MSLTNFGLSYSEAFKLIERFWPKIFQSDWTYLHKNRPIPVKFTKVASKNKGKIEEHWHAVSKEGMIYPRLSGLVQDALENKNIRISFDHFWRKTNDGTYKYNFTSFLESARAKVRDRDQDQDQAKEKPKVLNTESEKTQIKSKNKSTKKPEPVGDKEKAQTKSSVTPKKSSKVNEKTTTLDKVEKSTEKHKDTKNASVGKSQDDLEKESLVLKNLSDKTLHEMEELSEELRKLDETHKTFVQKWVRICDGMVQLGGQYKEYVAKLQKKSELLEVKVDEIENRKRKYDQIQEPHKNGVDILDSFKSNGNGNNDGKKPVKKKAKITTESVDSHQTAAVVTSKTKSRSKTSSKKEEPKAPSEQKGDSPDSPDSSDSSDDEDDEDFSPDSMNNDEDSTTGSECENSNSGNEDCKMSSEDESSENERVTEPVKTKTTKMKKNSTPSVSDTKNEKSKKTTITIDQEVKPDLGSETEQDSFASKPVKKAAEKSKTPSGRLKVAKPPVPTSAKIMKMHENLKRNSELEDLAAMTTEVAQKTKSRSVKKMGKRLKKTLEKEKTKIEKEVEDVPNDKKSEKTVSNEKKSKAAISKPKPSESKSENVDMFPAESQPIFTGEPMENGDGNDSDFALDIDGV